MTDILVLGAGMVGVSTALALQERGQVVTLVDRRGPGEETSYGNAGMIQAEAVEPYPLPLDLPTLFSIAMRRTNDVYWSFAGLRHWLGPVLRYARHSVPFSYRRNVVPGWAAMIHHATADHGALIAASGAEDLVARQGFRQVYRSERALAAAVAKAERLGREQGVPSAILSGAELSEAEPGLRRTMGGAVHWTGSWSCRDPGGLVQRYADLFVQRSGDILAGDAMSLRRSGRGWQVETETGPVSAAQAVICLGPWSPQLLARLGHKVPMVWKRGYHQHFSVSDGPRLPFMDVETGTFLSPMVKGLRVLTGAELNSLDAPPSLRQMGRSTEAARELFTLGSPLENRPWIGARPCLPAMTPMIGPSPRENGLWFNFGHGHQGFTLGPTTGRILAERMVHLLENG